MAFSLHRLAVLSGAFVASAACLTAGIPFATAATVAPGAPMVVTAKVPTHPALPAELDTARCSQGVPGTITLADGTKREVLVTAGHCVAALPGTQSQGQFVPSGVVYAPKKDGLELIGTADQWHIDFAANPGAPLSPMLLLDLMTGADWGVVTLEPGVDGTRVADSIDAAGKPSGHPVELTGVVDFPEVAPWGSSADNMGNPICKHGQTSGHSCGVQLFRTTDAVFSTGMNFEHGDSGGVNYDPRTNRVIGVTSQELSSISRTQPLDSALAAAFGVPDGHVAERFTLPASTAAHDGDFKPLNEEMAEFNQWADATLGPAPAPTTGSGATAPGDAPASPTLSSDAAEGLELLAGLIAGSSS
ncbi:chymotrypsin family serine protease [Corynebacterium uterequi]|uniref:Trypsin n=1 Tax=Corynebacterium uterequi TaxID=1072256 RepID=A0A0G3HEF5_9CORY|nr:hypothetical protein [Corynebacterium uterequi]AKK11711.1 hypothetical protein CUTER_08645 [Corynebacterium uterequi]